MSEKCILDNCNKDGLKDQILCQKHKLELELEKTALNAGICVKCLKKSLLE